VDRWEKQARARVEGGATIDEIASGLIERGSGPIDAVKALRSAGFTLAEGKSAVDRALPPAVRAANDRLREEATHALESTDD